MNITIGSMAFMLDNFESFTHIISIVDKSFNLDMLPKKALTKFNWFISVMDDLEDEPINPNNNVRVPTLEEVLEIIEFSSHLTDEDTILIHCHGGVCRSTAIAWLILVMHGMTFEAAMNMVQLTSSFAWPNMRIVNFGDRILGLGGKATHWMHNWRIENEVRLNAELFDI